jgi:GTP-binding protein Era
MERSDFKVGKVAIVGRPNVGKSTLLNNLVDHKVAIVSKKPQTTRSQIVAFHEDERGQIFFLDTPGFYLARPGTSQYNAIIGGSIEEADLIVYIVDHTRDWGHEEERIWNMILASEKPVILAINKIDLQRTSYKENYEALLEKYVKEVVEISALRSQHLKTLVDKIYHLLPTGERDITVDYFPTPLLSQSSKEYLAEIIREKIYQHTGQEVPYQTVVRVDSVEESEEDNLLKITGEILVPNNRYKAMLIGKKGQKIEQIRKAVRKELEIGTGKKVSISLKVKLDNK